MDIQQFIVSFAEAIEVEDISTLTPNTKFHDLAEWSSLAALSVVAMFDEEFEKILTNAELRATETIQDLYNLSK